MLSSVPFVTNKANLEHWPAGGQLYKQDAHDKSPQVGLRPAFLGGYQGSCWSIPSFVGRVKQTQFAPDGATGPSPRLEALTLPPATGASAPNKANFPA
jgi:hypothetical protein